MARINFDASQHEARKPFEALPKGWYKLAITDSSMEPTDKGDGAYLKLEHTVLEGVHKGRKVFNNLNLENPNPQAVEIAQQELAGLCQAVGVIRCEDSSQLHNIPVFCKIGLEAERTEDSLKNTVNPATKQAYKAGDPNTKTYEARNRIQGYKNIQDVPTGYTDGGSSAGPAAGSSSTPGAAWAVAKPATPGAAAPGATTATAPTTSNAVPPWQTGKPSDGQIAKEGPATPVATKEDAKPKGPKGPKKAAKPEAAPAVEPKFYVYFADDNMPVKTLSEIKADLASGMPADTQVLPEAEIKSDDPQWKDASTLFETEKKAEPAKQEAAPAADVPPWQRKK